jgi:uridine kinase
MSRKPYLIGIVGGSGSGKTSFLRDLLARLSEKQCAVISQDNYYRPIHEQERDANGQPNFDLPTSIHVEHFHADVQKLTRGEAITKTEYTFNHRERQGRAITVEPAEVLILEGLFLFHYEQISKMLDLRVFIDADLAICKARRLERDAHERGYAAAHVEYQWREHVLPAYEKYIVPYREQAHLVVANHADYDAGIVTVTNLVLQKLASLSSQREEEAIVATTRSSPG